MGAVLYGFRNRFEISGKRTSHFWYHACIYLEWTHWILLNCRACRFEFKKLDAFTWSRALKNMRIILVLNNYRFNLITLPCSEITMVVIENFELKTLLIHSMVSCSIITRVLFLLLRILFLCCYRIEWPILFVIYYSLNKLIENEWISN